MGQVQDIPENQADLTIGNLVVRKPTTSLSDKEIKQVRDLKLRLDLEDATKPARKAGLKNLNQKKFA